MTEDEDVVLDLDHALDQEVVQGEETVREVIQEIEEIVADIHDQDHQWNAENDRLNLLQKKETSELYSVCNSQIELDHEI